MMTKKSANSNTAKIVTSDKILVGSFFALRQAWELVSAASILHRAGKYSSAYGLAVFSREEVGKSRLLEKHWEASVAGTPVSAQELNSGDLRSHAKKLRAAGKVLSEGVFFQGMPPDRGSSEEYELVRHIRDKNARARETDPDSTHLGRLRSFYVELHDAGLGWWKPWTAFDSTRSRREILEAETGYALRRCELEALKEKVGFDTALASSLFLPPEMT
jgi:AbiV family abortive infection protein